jgi:hypothetical protein
MKFVVTHFLKRCTLCGDVTNGIRVDSLQSLEKGLGAIHDYIDDIWYHSRFIRIFWRRVGEIFTIISEDRWYERKI